MKGNNQTVAEFKASVRASYDLTATRPRIAMPWLSAPRCESPIEEAMLSALVSELHGVSIEQQVNIGRYRVDFLIGDKSRAPSVVVECDGRQFHDETFEQNRRDRIRDRFLQRLGLAVLRYGGAEIKAGATTCAEEVAAVYRNRLKHHSDGAA